MNIKFVLCDGYNFEYRIFQRKGNLKFFEFFPQSFKSNLLRENYFNRS